MWCCATLFVVFIVLDDDVPSDQSFRPSCLPCRYGLLGESLNVATYLEEANKRYGTDILVSAGTINHLKMCQDHAAAVKAALRPSSPFHFTDNSGDEGGGGSGGDGGARDGAGSRGGDDGGGDGHNSKPTSRQASPPTIGGEGLNMHRSPSKTMLNWLNSEEEDGNVDVEAGLGGAAGSGSDGTLTPIISPTAVAAAASVAAGGGSRFGRTTGVDDTAKTTCQRSQQQQQLSVAQRPLGRSPTTVQSAGTGLPPPPTLVEPRWSLNTQSTNATGAGTKRTHHDPNLRSLSRLGVPASKPQLRSLSRLLAAGAGAFERTNFLCARRGAVGGLLEQLLVSEQIIRHPALSRAQPPKLVTDPPFGRTRRQPWCCR